jgi:deazaflavin-dependent oxidoreductase (nitroreductase family)
MSLKQAIRDRVRVFNKYATNKVLIHIAGRRFGHFSIVIHTGRKTGRIYRTPVIAEPVENGFVIALTYGRKVDWAANVLARGGCSLQWKNHDYLLAEPRFIEKETGLGAFPGILKPALRMASIQDFLRLSIVKTT